MFDCKDSNFYTSKCLKCQNNKVAMSIKQILSRLFGVEMCDIKLDFKWYR